MLLACGVSMEGYDGRRGARRQQLPKYLRLSGYGAYIINFISSIYSPQLYIAHSCMTLVLPVSQLLLSVVCPTNLTEANHRKF